MMALQFFVDNMRAYAPRMILDIAATDPGSLLRPSSRAVPAAVLFADVVGFSGLVEEMTRADPDKVAHIASILDGYVERLVDLLLDHGGDIAKFAGDAVFAVWPANGDLAGALTRAARCAEEIQAELHELEQLPGVALSLRVVLASGELHVATIGGVYGHWEIVVAGEPIRQISRLGGLAEPGTVLLSPEAIEALDAAGRLEHVDGKARVLPVVLPPVPPHEVRLTQEGLEALLSFLPSAVATRPEIGTADDAELRPITTMFVVVRGFRYPGEATVDDAQRVLEAIQECIYDHDGALNRFGVDDKGAVALAAWGLPPDDPVEQHLLPVRAALAIRGRLAQLGLDARVGLTAGQVWCGSVGNDRRCEYTIHGRSVNLAARLMMSAGTVLMDEHVAAGARGAVDVRRATPLRTKGRPDRVEVFEVARADGATICARGVELA